MNPEEYNRFTESLKYVLSNDPRVLGLIALGSMAQRDYHPDEWSDHDFFVITKPGEQEAFREDPGWLPDAGEIVLHFRETAHGVKVLYRSGHLIEFAVFDLEELHVAKVNRYRILFDRGVVRNVVEEVAVETLRWTDRQRGNDAFDMGQFLTNLLVGVGRHMRGEQLSGRQFVKSGAVSHLLRLFARHLLPGGENRLDNLDPLRRFEQTFPQLGRELNAILDADTPRAAYLLLELAERELRPKLSHAYPVEAVEVVRAKLRSAADSNSAPAAPWS